MHRLALALTALLASCGTLMNDGPFIVPVSSSPAGATVYYRNSPVGTTPCQVAMEPDDTALRFCLAGYDSSGVSAQTSLNWWTVGNAVFLFPGVLIGDAIDLATGSFFVVDTTPIHVSMSSYRPTRNVEEQRPATSQRIAVVGTSLLLSSRSKLHGQLVTITQIDGKVVTVRAVESGETDAIEVPFVQEVEAARGVLDAKATIRLNCYYH